MVRADKMLCHDTVIPQPAGAHHDKQDVMSVASKTILSLALRLTEWCLFQFKEMTQRNRIHVCEHLQINHDQISDKSGQIKAM